MTVGRFWIGPRGHIAARLVEQHVDMMLGDLDAPAVDPDVIASGLRLGAKLAYRLAVDGDAALEHQLLAGPARSDSGLRQNLLYTFHC